MILTATAVALLLARPDCGAVKPALERELLTRLIATATVESGFDSLMIGVNGVPQSERMHRFQTKAEALAFARDLDRRHIDYDAGLFQENRKYGFVSDGLTPETAFDECANARAAVHHLRTNYAQIHNMASRLYNCGGLGCGQQYAALVDAAALRLRDAAYATRTLAVAATPSRVSIEDEPVAATPFYSTGE